MTNYLKCKDSLLLWDSMVEIIKVTSKGQITLPSRIRKSLKIKKDSYIVVDTIGDFIVMKRIGGALEEISRIFQETALKNGITKNDINAAIQESREKIWEL